MRHLSTYPERLGSMSKVGRCRERLECPVFLPPHTPKPFLTPGFPPGSLHYHQEGAAPVEQFQ